LGAILVLASLGVVIEHARKGFELVYASFLVLLGGPVVRSWLVARDRAEPASAVVRVLIFAGFSGLVAYPFGIWGHIAAAAATLALARAAGAPRWVGAPITIATLFFASVLLHGREPSGEILLLALAAVATIQAARAAWSGPVDATPPPRRPLTTARRACFVAVIAVVFIGLAELGSYIAYTRLVSPDADNSFRKLLDREGGGGYFPAYRPHPYTCFELNPDYETPEGRWHSKDGFRLPEMPRERRPGTLRIAVVGGSTVYEPDMPLPNTFCAYLEELLNRSFPGHPIEVLNAGVGGANSADNFGRFHFKVLDYAPDLVVNYDGINDVWPMLCPGPFENDLRHARKVMEPSTAPGPLATFFCRHTWSFRLFYWRLVLKGRVAHIMDLTYRPMTPTEETYRGGSTGAFRRDLEDEAFICRGRGIELVLCTFAADDSFNGRDPEKDPWALLIRGVDDLNPVVKDVAAKQALPLLDFDRLMPRNDPSRPVSERYFADICHNTVRGNLVKANIFGRFLVPLLEKRFGLRAVPFELPTAPQPSYPPAHLER